VVWRAICGRLGRALLGGRPVPLVLGVENLKAAPVLGLRDDALVAGVHQLLAIGAGWAPLGQPVFRDRRCRFRGDDRHASLWRAICGRLGQLLVGGATVEDCGSDLGEGGLY
jgi:hypothetical protein